MKNFLNRIQTAGIAATIPEDAWIWIRAVNVLAVIFIVTLFVVSFPPPDTLTAMAALQLATLGLIQVRASEIDQKMVEIDRENDRRDDQMSRHIEVAIQDIHWLVRRELARDEMARDEVTI